MTHGRQGGRILSEATPACQQPHKDEKGYAGEYLAVFMSRHEYEEAKNYK